MSSKNLVITTVVVGVLFAFLSDFGVNVPSPPDSLMDWTAWAIAFIALLKAPGFVDALVTRLKG